LKIAGKDEETEKIVKKISELNKQMRTLRYFA